MRNTLAVLNTHFLNRDRFQKTISSMRLTEKLHFYAHKSVIVAIN